MPTIEIISIFPGKFYGHLNEDIEQFRNAHYVNRIRIVFFKYETIHQGSLLSF